MARKKKPKSLGLILDVYHPDSMAWDVKKEGLNPWEKHQDADGFATRFQMEEMKGEFLMTLCLRRGISRQVAARLLRMIADKIEHLEVDLLSLKRGIDGHFTDGGVELSTLFADLFDEHGNLIDKPDAFPIPE